MNHTHTQKFNTSVSDNLLLDGYFFRDEIEHFI